MGSRGAMMVWWRAFANGPREAALCTPIQRDSVLNSGSSKLQRKTFFGIERQKCFASGASSARIVDEGVIVLANFCLKSRSRDGCR